MHIQGIYKLPQRLKATQYHERAQYPYIASLHSSDISPCSHTHTPTKIIFSDLLDMTLPVVVRLTSGPFSLRGLSTSVIFVSSQLVCRAAAIKLQDDTALLEF